MLTRFVPQIRCKSKSPRVAFSDPSHYSGTQFPCFVPNLYFRKIHPKYEEPLGKFLRSLTLNHLMFPRAKRSFPDKEGVHGAAGEQLRGVWPKHPFFLVSSLVFRQNAAPIVTWANHMFHQILVYNYPTCLLYFTDEEKIET